MLSTIIASVFNQDIINNSKQKPLRVGQIFNGTITNLYQNQTAEVRIGDIKVIAKLDAPLIKDRHYWLQVQPGEGQVRLKVLTDCIALRGSQSGPETVLNTLDIPAVKDTTRVVQFFIKSNLPISRDIILETLFWLKGQNDKNDGLNTIKWMIQNEYPFTKEIFDALSALKVDKSFMELVRHLYSQLETIKEKSLATVPLRDFISNNLLNNNITENTFLDNDAIVSVLKNTLKSMGISYEKILREHHIFAEEETKIPITLKGLLLKYQAEVQEGPLKTIVEQIINKITGMQLISKDLGPVQQLIFQLPFPLLKGQTELTMQWNGRRKEDGKIDPDFCRVIFYLSLENLKETFVDVIIQNRVVSIKIMNDNGSILKATLPDQLVLKEKLRVLNYRLLNIQFENVTDNSGLFKTQNVIADNMHQSYSGVDVKV